jgi:hypothetical protein
MGQVLLSLFGSMNVYHTSANNIMYGSLSELVALKIGFATVNTLKLRTSSGIFFAISFIELI